jgi:hypothetical protein
MHYNNINICDWHSIIGVIRPDFVRPIYVGILYSYIERKNISLLYVGGRCVRILSSNNKKNQLLFAEMLQWLRVYDVNL